MDAAHIRRWIREPVNGLSHFAGALLATGGLVWLVMKAKTGNPTAPLWPLVVFGGTMILLFVTSALYHSLPVSPRAIARLRQLDHVSIYLFIAGTYTPICLLLLGGGFGRGLLIAVWTLALGGVAFEVVWTRAPRWLSVLTYLGLGWLGVLVLPQVTAVLSPHALTWLVVGGVCYTVGAGIYALRWPNPLPGWIGFHEIWHVCVLAGAFSHFWSLRTYVAP